MTDSKKGSQDISAFLQFLNRSPTPWHAVEAAKELLIQEGFSELSEKEPWKIKPSQRYFVVRNGSSICAFITPQKKPKGVHVVASHTDSPGFKLKPNAEFRKENMIMLGVEVYGGPLITSWLNRDLGIAGRVVYMDKKGHVKEDLVCLDQAPVVIPQLAIHLDREVNEKGLLLNRQEHLAALAALVSESKKDQPFYLEKLLQEKIAFKQLLGTDLFLFPLEPAALVGHEQQMIASYRIDNLMSLHASLVGLSSVKKASEDCISMIASWDHEEIGSGTAQGAGSPFLLHVLERITLGLEMGREEHLRLIHQSLCVSVDLGHAWHPGYPEKHEGHHRLFMEGGIIIKYNAQNKYASDARSAAMIVALCEKNKIPVQKFVTRGDIPSGSTIGPIHAHTTGMMTVDIGCAQLSMHSCRELVACQDYRAMCTLLSEVLKS